MYEAHVAISPVCSTQTLLRGAKAIIPCAHSTWPSTQSFLCIPELTYYPKKKQQFYQRILLDIVTVIPEP